MPNDTVTMSREGPQPAVYVCLSCMRRISLMEVWQVQEPERSAPTYTHHTVDGHPVVRIDGLQPADAGGCEELRALVREWQMARRPSQLPAPGADLVETYRHAVQRMAVVDEALARFNLGGPAGGALVGQTAPTESTGPYTDEYAVETLMHLARTLSEVDEQHSCLRGALAIKAIAARAQGVGRAVYLGSSAATRDCADDVCQAAKHDGILCADGECNYHSGIRKPPEVAPTPTPEGRETMPVLVEAFRFTSYQEWVDSGRNKPWTWVMATSGKHSEEICADSRGRVCRMGRDFQRAHDEGTFPVIAYRVRDAITESPR